MRIQGFEVSYDSGMFQERMGLGPGILLKAGLLNRLRFFGHEIGITRVRTDEPFPAEIKTTFSLARLLARDVASAHAAGALAVVLSGNCNAAIGTIAGLDPAKTCVLWFDAHGEFHTPETTRSGFLDGMGLAIATGYCWRNLAGSIPEFVRLPAKNVILAGIRDLDPEEQDSLDQSGVQQIPAEQIRNRGMRPLLAPAFAVISRRIERVYIHFDLDVLDPSEARWNQWTPPDGLTVGQIEEAVETLAGGPGIAGIGFASYDPAIDPENSFEAARRLLDAALRVAGA
jgi:arginase